MIIPTVQEYKEVIPRLNKRQRDVLIALYECPNATSTTQDLAKKMFPSNPRIFSVNGLIGRTGKHISDLCGIVPEKRKAGVKRVTYIPLVSQFYQTNIGWRMHKNLQTALEQLGYVNKTKFD